MNIAITGASGFVGRQLIQTLENGPNRITALSRSPIANLPQSARWQETDLFSAQSTADALREADVAIYLVHSMMPSTRLFQGDFHDTDLLLADNFTRACSANRVRRIIYLGGLQPTGYVSPHLASRHEVGDVLRSSGIPVTELRCGMIVGPGGSSFEILKSLVEKLPFMILPEWTQRKTQAVFIDDVIRVLQASIEDPNFDGRTIDVVNGESLTYESLLRQMAETLGVKRKMLRVPIHSTEFSKAWVTWFGRSSYALVSPLIDSLLCDLPDTRPSSEIQGLIKFSSFRSMADEALKRPKLPNRSSRGPRTPNSVRSIQRLPSIPFRNCEWIAAEYMSFLPALFRAGIRVESDSTTGMVRFKPLLFSFSLLELQYIESKSTDNRIKFHIVGGVLSRTTKTGWLEFRQIENRKYTVAAIHEFIPSLPWFIYRMTQGPLHRWVMFRFTRHLRNSKTIEAKES